MTDMTQMTDLPDPALSWAGWEWPHDPGGIVQDGPGAVEDWDAWQAARQSDITRADAAEAAEGTPYREARMSIAAQEREYGEAAQDAAEAWRDCILAARRAVADGDAEAASEAVSAASAIESEYGDDPATRWETERLGWPRDGERWVGPPAEVD